MAQQIVNSFTQFSLTDEEQIAGQTLTTNNLLCLQNHKAVIAQEKLNLTYDPDAPQKYALNLSFLAGQLALIDYLIELHETAVSYQNPQM